LLKKKKPTNTSNRTQKPKRIHIGLKHWSTRIAKRFLVSDKGKGCKNVFNSTKIMPCRCGNGIPSNKPAQKTTQNVHVYILNLAKAIGKRNLQGDFSQLQKGLQQFFATRPRFLETPKHQAE
jgi:hypothetical protein